MKSELTQVARQAMADLEVTDQDEEFVQAVAAIMWRKMLELDME